MHRLLSDRFRKINTSDSSDGHRYGSDAVFGGDPIYVLQSTDEDKYEDHINCVSGPEELAKQAKINTKNKYKVSENFDWVKKKEQIDENIKSNSFVLVDARSHDRFEGKKEEPRPGLKKGCVPGSKNIPFQNCINVAANTFKSKSELVNIFKENNVDYYKPTVFMCGSGISACVLGLAYFLISDKNAVIYDGSFAEWGKK